MCVRWIHIIWFSFRLRLHQDWLRASLTLKRASDKRLARADCQERVTSQCLGMTKSYNYGQTGLILTLRHYSSPKRSPFLMTISYNLLLTTINLVFGWFPVSSHLSSYSVQRTAAWWLWLYACDTALVSCKKTRLLFAPKKMPNLWIPVRVSWYAFNHFCWAVWNEPFPLSRWYRSMDWTFMKGWWFKSSTCDSYL